MTPTNTDPVLPVISLARLRDLDTRAEELPRLRQVTHEIGFFYLDGHDVPRPLQDELFAAAREFFALPPETKAEISNISSPHYRGYAHIGDEYTRGVLDWREQIDVAVERPAQIPAPADQPWRVLEGPNLWPEEVPQLEELVTRWLELSTRIGLELLRAWAESLGQDPGVFDPACAEPFPVMKIAHYPGHDGSTTGQGVGAHKDTGILTLLLPEPGSTGLQVLRDGTWLDVETLPGVFVVNIGELLEAATDGYLTATPHRVLPPAPGTGRYSLPYFLNPSLDSVFPRVTLPAELSAAARGTGADMNGQTISGVTGLNVLKSRLRAHPEITARHHAELAAALV